MRTVIALVLWSLAGVSAGCGGYTNLGDPARGGAGSSNGDGDANATGGSDGASTSSGGSGSGGDSFGGTVTGGTGAVGGDAGPRVSGGSESAGGNGSVTSGGRQAAGGTEASGGIEASGGTPTGGMPAGGSASATGGTQASGGAPPGEGGGTSIDRYAGAFKILVLSKALEFAHSSIADCQNLLKELGATSDANMPAGTKPGSQFTTTIANTDLSDFSDDKLKSYAMLFWCNPTGTVFSSGGTNGKAGMAAIQKFVEGGGAWGGVHSATDFEKTNGFPWFTNTLLGGYFDHHDNDGTTGTVQVQAAFASHPVVRGVQATWNTQDEWYYMNRDVSSLPDFKILSRLTKDNRPVVWVKELGTNKAGRMFYTIRGHASSVYKEKDFRTLVLNGILWATHRLD